MNVLIIDDHGLFRAGLVQLLHSLDTSIQAIAIASFKDLSSPPFAGKGTELLLLDYHIPGHDPLENIRSACQFFPTAKIVVVSAETRSDAIINAIENGASGFIPKRAEPDVMIAALELVLAGGVYLPHEVTLYYQNDDAQACKKRRAEPSLDDLSVRQKEVLAQAVNGLSNQQIASDLGISIDTVKAHLSKAYRILGVHSRTQALLACNQLGGLR